MQVLLTGKLPQSVWTMARRLIRGGHQAVVLGHAEKPLHLDKNIKFHDTDPESHEAGRLIEASRFDAVIFFFAWQCEPGDRNSQVQGSMLDALLKMLQKSEGEGVRQFTLVTDRRVFGAAQEGIEEERPLPDTSAGLLIRTAEDCLFAAHTEKMETRLVRVTSLYEEQDPHSFFAYASSCAQTGIPLILDGSRETPCDFLHADDLAIYFNLTLGTRTGAVTHLYYGKPYTYGDLEKLLQNLYQGLVISFSNEQGRTATLSAGLSRKADWVPRHDFSLETKSLSPTAQAREQKQPRLKPHQHRLLRLASMFAELALFGVLAAYLEHLAQTNALLGVINYMLLYVAVMGVVHGRHIGQLAALIACVHYAYSWSAGGNDLYLLLYNPDHWLPLSSYLLIGSLFGYLRDKAQTLLESLQDENSELKAQSEFLNNLYRQVHEDRERLHEQVLHTRDSFGRIYKITQELDALIPQQVFLSALDVLEDIMQTQSVAIYENPGDKPFARLVVHSRSLKLAARSLDLNRFSQMMESLKKGKVFVNKNLLPDFPSYAAPVVYEGSLVAMLILWSVPFDKQSQYYENLFSVVAGLVQGSVGRAFRYFKESGEIYIEDTHILCDSAFRSALEVYKNIRKRRKGQYLLVRVNNAETMEHVKVDSCIRYVIRANDLAGQLSDGHYYILFPQATTENMEQINMRFRANAKKCDLYLEEVSDV